MRARKFITTTLAFVMVALALPACRNRSETFVIVLSDKISTLDPIGSPVVDAASERIRALVFNSLVKKNEKFDYIPD